MKTFIRVTFAVLLLWTVFPSSAATQASQQHQEPVTTAFVNVAVVPMDEERVLRNQTVVVRDARIVEVGPAESLHAPPGAVVIDGTGKFLMPGLAEMHAHIPSPQQGEDTIDRTLFLYLSNGVTTIRGMLGHPRHLELRGQAERGEILSPRIYTSGPSLNGNSAQTAEIAATMVEEQHAAGYDLLKLHPGLTRPVFDAMAAAAHALEMPFAGHVSADVGLHPALAARQASIDHLDGYVEALAGYGDGFSSDESGLFGLGLIDQIDSEKIRELAAATREAGVWNVPTQSLLEHLLSSEDLEEMARRPELRYMPPATVRQWMDAVRGVRGASGGRERAERYLDARRRLISALQEEGAGLLLGSDAPQIFNVPGFSIHHELRALVASGLTPYQALVTGTRNPATYFGAEDWGTVTVGSSADLILVNDNPLENVGNVERPAGVMVRGHWLPDADIQTRLEEIAVAVQK